MRTIGSASLARANRGNNGWEGCDVERASLHELPLVLLERSAKPGIEGDPAIARRGEQHPSESVVGRGLQKPSVLDGGT